MRATGSIRDMDAAPHAEATVAGLESLVLQHPLIETRPSLGALRRAPVRPPAAVFVGIGVASGHHVSQALPLDVLGLLLSAEAVRRRCGASRLHVLLADAHAIAAGADPQAVRTRAAAYARSLRRVAERCQLGAMELQLASALHVHDDYRGTLRAVEARAPREESPYVTREVADIAHLDAQLGGVLKVGWALQASEVGTRCDERLFDRRFRAWVGRELPFVYAKAGRALDDGHRKAAPYIEREPARRVCLRPGERVADKLRAARGEVSESTLRGVRNHLSAIARSHGKIVGPRERYKSAPLEERLQVIVDTLCAEGLRADTGGVRTRHGRRASRPAAADGS